MLIHKLPVAFRAGNGFGLVSGQMFFQAVLPFAFEVAQMAFLCFLLPVFGVDFEEVGVQLFLADEHSRATFNTAIFAEKRLGRMLLQRVCQ